MKKFYQKFISKVGVIFLMSLMFGMLSCADVYATDNYVPKKDYSANLIAKWIFDDTNTSYIQSGIAKDLSGKGNNLTLNNITFVDDADLGRCAYFNGTNSYGLCNKNILPLGKKSIVLTLKSQKGQVLSYGAIGNNFLRATTSAKYLNYIYTDSDYSVAYYSLGSSTSDNFANKILFTFDNTNNMNLFINNLINPSISKVGVSETFSTSSQFTIGYNSSTTLEQYKNWYNGYIQSIEIYNDIVEYEVKATATGISLNKTTSDLTVGLTDNLVATITPEDAINKTVKWTSSHSEIATVNETTGLVTAVTTGSAIITATTTDGSNLSASCTVNVILPYGNRAVLTITMTNGQTKEYDLSMSEVDNFIQWYNNNNNNNNNNLQSYKFAKNYNINPFRSRTEYIAHSAVSSFEVNEYTE